MHGTSSKSTSAALPGPSMCEFPVGSKPAGKTQTLRSSLVAPALLSMRQPLKKTNEQAKAQEGGC